VALVKVHHHQLDSGAVSLAATFSLGLPALWLAVAGYLETRRPEQTSEFTMAHVADQLAIAVGAEWEAEARVRRLNDPYPLPVSWDAADASLTDSWESLLKLASSGAGWPTPPPEGTWASGPDDLAGEGSELAEVLARVPTGRLVVLGEPGAGKTMLMVRLVLDLLARRASGGPVPIMASVASWNPSAQDLRNWLGAQLQIDHPALAGPPPPGRTEPTRAAALLASELILPVLDGLDEIPEEVRGPAISRINDALRPGEPIVVTCRTQQYRDAIRPQGGLEVTLRAAAAIQLRPLDADAIRSYLCDDAAGPVAKARWAPVLTLLGTEEPAGQALRTPLMVGLARAIYNPRPGELAGTLRDPAQLCSPALADRTAVESLLFDAFIPAAYRNDPPGRWKTQDAERWLVFLARYLERTIASADLAWWQLRQAAPPIVAGIAAGVAAGVVAGLVAGLAGGTGIGAAAGAVAGVVTGAVAGIATAARGVTRPSRGVRIRTGRVAAGFAAGLVAGLGVAVGLNAIPGEASGVGAVLLGGLVSGALLGLAAGLVFGFRAIPGDLAAAASPGVVLARDRRAARIQGLVAGTVALLVAGLATLTVWTFVFASSTLSWTDKLGLGLLFGLVFGLVFGLGFNAVATAWPSYALTRGVLALRHRLPWQLMRFLVDAHKRGVLRQAGAVYQFRHIELQHRLANRDASEQ
jgi:NACHT domain-containing protein